MTDVMEQQKFMQRMQDRCLNILADRSTLTKTQIKNRWKKTDWWLEADEALEFGFIDEVR
jgi:ATP-dependent protease ClpP protease subunit